MVAYGWSESYSSLNERVQDMTSVFKNSEECKRWGGLRKIYKEIETRQHRCNDIDRWVVSYVQWALKCRMKKRRACNRSTWNNNNRICNLKHEDLSSSIVWQSCQTITTENRDRIASTSIIRHCEKRDYGDKWKLQDDGPNSGPKKI